MPYVFPQRVLQAGDPLFRTDLNAEWQLLGEKVSGRLDAHDFNGASLTSSILIADSALSKPYYKSVSVNGGWGSATAGYTAATVAAPPADAWFVPISSSWAGVDEMYIDNVDTGVSNLWVVGWVAYVYHEFTVSNGAPGGHSGIAAGAPRSASLQIAIRVDGQIVPETITGHADDFHISCQPLKPVDQRNPTRATASDRRFPGPGLYDSESVRGVGPQAGAIRVTAHVPVTAGGHVVEIVARVIRPELSSFPSAATAAVAIHNRKLFVLDCPIFPASAPAREAVTVPSFDVGDTLNQAALKAARSDVLLAEYNAVEDGHVARGAFNNYHLPATLYDKSFVSVVPATSTAHDNRYPGYGIDTMVSRAGSFEGWSWVEDGAGGPLRTDYDTVRGAVDFEATAVKSVIVVMANVQINQITMNVGGQQPSICGFAACAIAYKPDGGAIQVLGETEAYVNNYVEWGYAAGSLAALAIEYDMPLFHVFNYSDTTGGTPGALGAADVDYIGVVASGFRTSITGGGTINLAPDIEINRGALTCLQIRG